MIIKIYLPLDETNSQDDWVGQERGKQTALEDSSSFRCDADFPAVSILLKKQTIE